MADREPESEFDEDDDDSDEDGDCPFGDPFLEDGFGNLTNFRLSDLTKEFTKHFEDEASKPKPEEKKLSKEEKLKLHNDRLEQYMKAALRKYNDEKNLDGESCFEFVKAMKESFIIEGDIILYHHFNFSAMQNHSTICLFFAEVIPDGDCCDVTCCKILQDNDNGICLGCQNQGNPKLVHPACENVYAGGHENCICPFLIDTDSEDD